MKIFSNSVLHPRKLLKTPHEEKQSLIERWNMSKMHNSKTPNAKNSYGNSLYTKDGSQL